MHGYSLAQLYVPSMAHTYTHAFTILYKQTYTHILIVMYTSHNYLNLDHMK